MKKLILLLILAISIPVAHAQVVTGANEVRQGNEYYRKGEIKKAEESYKKSLEIGTGTFQGAFNLGDALYKQEKYQESAQIFKQLAETAQDRELKAKAYHNLGNSLMKAEQYKPSVEAYKNALRNNPSDEDTRYNLSMALRKLQEQEQQEQNQDKQDKNEEQKEQDQQQQQQQNKEENEKKEEKEQQQNQDQQQQQQQQPQQGQLSKEEAERMLDALNNEEKDLQEKMKAKMIKPNQKQIEKDW